MGIFAVESPSLKGESYKTDIHFKGIFAVEIPSFSYMLHNW